MIKFNLHNVTDTTTGNKARVHYSINNRVDGRECVTVYHKDHTRAFDKVFANHATNGSDLMTNYHEKSKAVFFADDPLYPAALKAAKRAEDKAEAKWLARRAA